jgi:multiple sugar transport system permease protein
VALPMPEPAALLGYALNGRMLSTYLPNTVLYAVSTALIVMLLAGLSGYAFSRYRFRGHDALMIAILAITGVPLLTNLLALYQMGASIRHGAEGVYNDRVFIIIVYTGFYLPMSVWIAKGFFDAIPRELEEAAFLDGCSEIGAFRHVVLPLSRPGIAACAAYVAIVTWSDLVFARTLMSKPDNWLVTVGLQSFTGEYLVEWSSLMAAATLSVLPMLVLFVLLEPFLVKGMTQGAMAN